jgi:hypothetical protein
MINMFYNYWDNWKDFHKVTFDGINKIIYVSNGTTELDVKTEIYSDWKEWLTGSQHDGLINAKYIQAMRAVGGDPLPADRFVGTTYFLINGWRIKPYDGNYRITVNGNLYTDAGDDAFLDPDIGRVTIVQTVSTLVETVGVTEVVSAQSSDDIRTSVWGAVLSDYDATNNAAEIVLKIKQLANLIPGTL